MDTKKAIIIVILAAVFGFVLGTGAYSLFDLGAHATTENLLGIIIGNSAAYFGMRSAVAALILVLLFVPSVRSEFSGTVASGRDYKQSSKGRGRGRI